MRVYSGAIGTVRYPDEVAFAFNPNRIIVGTDKEVTVSVGGKYMEKREPFMTMAEFDISKYLQALVNRDVRSKVVEVTVSTETGSMSFSLTVVWGALNIGEAFNAPKTVDWFSAYPFTFDLYVPADATLEVTNGSGDSVGSFVRLDDVGSGIVSIDVNELFPLAKSITFRLTKGESTSVFDYTFDHTFREFVEGGVSEYVMKRDGRDCGAYLRWIDRHGMMQYYLFDMGEHSQIDKAADMKKGVFTGESYEYLTSVYERKEATHNVRLCAPLVTDEVFERLKTMNTSACVELYYNGEWLPVNIEPVSVQKAKRKVLQDYEVNMIYPVMMMQML